MSISHLLIRLGQVLGVLAILWVDKSIVMEWFFTKIHCEDYRREYIGASCIDKRCEGYKTLCFLLVYLYFVMHRDNIEILLAASVPVLLTFIRWIMHTDTMPFLDQKGLEEDERIPLVWMVPILAFGYFFNYDQNKKLSLEYWLYVLGFGLFFTIIYAVAACEKEMKEKSNYVICMLLFSLLGFGVAATANRYGKQTIVDHKQVIIEEICTGARIPSSIVFENGDGYLGKKKMFIPSNMEKKFSEGQTITLGLVKGQFGMQWICILQE